MANMSAKEIAEAIAKSPETQQLLGTIANEIAERATQEADALVGDQHDEAPHYHTDVKVRSDRAVAHINAGNGAAIHAERKAQLLPKIADGYGRGHEGKASKKKPTHKHA